jgi:hypothetical protein
MKFFTRLATFVLALFFAIGPVSADDGNHWKLKCSKQHPAIYKTINRFCHGLGTSRVVPDDYTYNGVSSGKNYDSHTLIVIRGACAPKQWLPQEYCYSQFFQMCKFFSPPASRH